MDEDWVRQIPGILPDNLALQARTLSVITWILIYIFLFLCKDLGKVLYLQLPVRNSDTVSVL